jgi:biotin transport system substrate-specific component
LAPAIYGLGDRLLGTHHGLWQRGILLWLSGAVLVDGLGALWLSIGLHMPLTSALMASLIFIPGDTLKTVLATLVAERVQHALPVHD